MMIPPMRQYQLSTSLNIAADVASTSCNSSKLRFPRKKTNLKALKSQFTRSQLCCWHKEQDPSLKVETALVVLTKECGTPRSCP